MEGVGGDTASMASPVQQHVNDAWRVYQYYLEKTTPHAVNRCVGTLVMAVIYCLRVYYVQGFYTISYALRIYVLNLLIGFLSPLVNPELDTSSDGPILPTKGSDEFKPFICRLPEFKFWYSMTKAFFIAFVMTLFSFFDIPGFWPIFLSYWIVLFVLTMRRHIAHMMKYKYSPFSLGKQYGREEGFWQQQQLSSRLDILFMIGPYFSAYKQSSTLMWLLKSKTYFKIDLSLIENLTTQISFDVETSIIYILHSSICVFFSFFFSWIEF